MPKQLKLQNPRWPPTASEGLAFTSNQAHIAVALFLQDHPGSFLKAVNDHLSEATGDKVNRNSTGNYLRELVRLGIVRTDPEVHQPGYPMKYYLVDGAIREKLDALSSLFTNQD